MNQFDNTKDINYAIASNLKSIRKQKELSLDALANLSGVSKSMLGQIERQESSPTITTLWKIATALHISFTSLLENSGENLEVIKKDNLKPLLSNRGKFRLFPMFPYNSERNFEMFYIEMDKGAISKSSEHEKGTFEYVIVYSGKFEIEIDNKSYILKEGDAIKYGADKVHTYKNLADTQTNICMVIYYE